MYSAYAQSPVNLEEIIDKLDSYSDPERFLSIMSGHFKLRSGEFAPIEKALQKVVGDFEGINRDAGGPYVRHLLRTAALPFCISGREEDRCSTSVQERLLHDWLEDIGHSSHRELYEMFGAIVTHTVSGVTAPQVKRPVGFTDEEYKRLRQYYKFGRVVKFGRRSMRVKCDDRFDNIATLWGTPEEKRLKIIETMEFVFPISMQVGNTLLPELIAGCVQQLDRLHENDRLNLALV